MLWRIRATSFLAGVAIAGSFALYQLRQDLWDSHAILAAQAEAYDKGVEQRVTRLEGIVAQISKDKQ